MVMRFVSLVRPGACALSLLIGLCGASPGLVRADVGECLHAWSASTEGLVLRLEEDAFLRMVPSTDWNYTGGGSLSLLGDWVQSSGLSAPLDLVNGWFGLDTAQLDLRLCTGSRSAPGVAHRHHAFTIGLTVFTPESRNLVSRDVVRDDRPYASLAYLSVATISAYPSRGLAISSDLRVGMLGLDQARQVQSQIHYLGRPPGCSPDDPGCAAPEPHGWGHQISAGGEPTVGLGLQLDRLLLTCGLVYCDAGALTRGRWGKARLLDVKAALRGDVGYLTSLSAAATVRLGLLNTEFWGFEASPMGPVSRFGTLAITPNMPSAAPTSLDGSEARLPAPSGWLPEGYLFASVGGRATLYNALLQGQFRHSDYRVPASKVRHWSYDYAIGLVGGVRWVTLTWTALAGRSPEADFQRTRNHQWASFFLAISWQG